MATTTENNLPTGIWTVALAPMVGREDQDVEVTSSDFFTALSMVLSKSFDIVNCNNYKRYQLFFNCDTPQGAEIDGYFDLTPTFDYARHNYSAKGRITASQFCKMALKDAFANIQGEKVCLSCLPLKQFTNL